MRTIIEIDLIAKRATERIAKEFSESRFSNPPVVTHGIARAVLEAAEQKRAADSAKAARLARKNKSKSKKVAPAKSG